MDTATRGQRLVALASLGTLAFAAAIPPDAALSIRAAPAAVGAFLAALALARPGAGSAVAVLAAGIESVALSGLPWQAVMPLALAILAVLARRQIDIGPRPLRLGHVPMWPTFACAAVTPVALVGWVILFEPDLTDITSGIPPVHPAILFLGAAVFAVSNALFEECIWRGVFQSRLTLLFPPSAAVLLQAVSFGAAHAHGFPRGAAGIALAGTWGAMLGLLRRSGGGLLAPVIAHVVADATIAAIVLLWLL